MDVCIKEPLCCWYFTSLWNQHDSNYSDPSYPRENVFSFSQKKGLLTTCLLNGRRQRETAIYQQNRQQYVSVHTDENSQQLSSSYCSTTWEMYIRGAFDQITNAIQMSLQMLSSWLLFGIKRTLWLLSALCLQWIPQQTSPHAKHWPAHSPWRLQKQT